MQPGPKWKIIVRPCEPARKLGAREMVFDGVKECGEFFETNPRNIWKKIQLGSIYKGFIFDYV